MIISQRSSMVYKYLLFISNIYIDITLTYYDYNWINIYFSGKVFFYW